MNLLAFDTSTQTLSVAVQAKDQVVVHTQAGGAQASAALIPVIFKLLADTQIKLSQLDAIAFGIGPGAFTGLRTATAVALGLSAATHIPLIPINTLLAAAYDAHLQYQLNQISVVLDARMNEVYTASFDFTAQADAEQLKAWHSQGKLTSLEKLKPPSGFALVGHQQSYPATPTASSMLPLANLFLKQGLITQPQNVEPLYIRNQVAQTLVERKILSSAYTARF